MQRILHVLQSMRMIGTAVGKNYSTTLVREGILRMARNFCPGFFGDSHVIPQR
jgi:hypothetical protein